MSKSKIIQHLNALAASCGCELVRAPQSAQEWLREHSAGLPSKFIEILASSWPGSVLDVGPYRLDSLPHLAESERAKMAYRGGFFCIGAAGNGDPLVVKHGSGNACDLEIGLLSHEQLCECGPDLTGIYEPICRGLEELLARAEVDGELPWDFFEAKRRRSPK